MNGIMRFSQYRILSCTSGSLDAEGLSEAISMSIPEEFRPSVKASLQISLREQRQRIREETDRFVIWSSRSFDSMRKDDHFSLRNKSEDETASSLAENLILETRLSLQETDQALEEGIDNLKNAVVQEAHFSIEHWDKSFQDEFQIGLEKWNRAEEELIAERLDWELRIETGYCEAEQFWDEALIQFSQQRREWIQEVSLLLEEGRQAWAFREDSFSEQFQSIAQDIEAAAAEQEYKFSKQVQSALELYRENLSLLSAAKENSLFYQNKMNQLQGSISSQLSDILTAEVEKKQYTDRILDFQARIDAENLQREEEGLPPRSHSSWDFSITIQEKCNQANRRPSNRYVCQPGFPVFRDERI